MSLLLVIPLVVLVWHALEVAKAPLTWPTINLGGNDGGRSSLGTWLPCIGYVSSAAIVVLGAIALV